MTNGPQDHRPLTDEEIAAIADAVPVDGHGVIKPTWHLRFARAVEKAALRERALQALIYHRDQTRPIDRTDDAITALGDGNA